MSITRTMKLYLFIHKLEILHQHDYLVLMVSLSMHYNWSMLPQSY
jgi:hypothetical protein